jgi:hypothetical protein
VVIAAPPVSCIDPMLWEAELGRHNLFEPIMESVGFSIEPIFVPGPVEDSISNPPVAATPTVLV